MNRVILPSLAGASLLLVSAVAAQTSDEYEPPRTQSGRPDLQGTWTNASITTLQRHSRYDSLVLSPDEVEQATRTHPQNVRQATDDNLQSGWLGPGDGARL